MEFPLRCGTIPAVKTKRNSTKKPATRKKAASPRKSARVPVLKNSSPGSLATFAALRTILSEFDGKLRVTKDLPGNYEVVSLEPTYKGKPMYFGSRNRPEELRQLSPVSVLHVP